MPKFNPVDAKDFTDQLLAAGFESDGIARFLAHEKGEAAVDIKSNGVLVRLVKNVPGSKCTAHYTGITHQRFPLPNRIRTQQECIDLLIAGAKYNKEFGLKTEKAISSILEVFRASGTPMNAVTADLSKRLLAEFYVGSHCVAYLAKTNWAYRSQGIFKFVAPDMFDYPDDMDELEEDEEPKNGFYFSSTAQLLCRIKEFFDQPTPNRKYKRIGDEIATLEKPGAFLDIAFEYGLTWISEKEVSTFRTAHCTITDELLDGDKRTIKLYALGLKAAPEKL
jgi:hypothetical protein